VKLLGVSCRQEAGVVILWLRQQRYPHVRRRVLGLSLVTEVTEPSHGQSQVCHRSIGKGERVVFRLDLPMIISPICTCEVTRV
jgi:hypothetical protein